MTESEPTYHAARYAHAHYLSNPENPMMTASELAIRAGLVQNLRSLGGFK
jgi:hypothetical protein